MEELKKLGNIHGYTLSTNAVFSKWQGRMSALLSYDPITKHKFDHCCDYIFDEHEFERGLISHEVVEAEKKIHALIERSIADLEINVPESPKSFIREALITDAFGPASPLPKLDTLPKQEDMRRIDLTIEEGPLWFLHHCHYTVKWKLVSMTVVAAVTLLGIGWLANEQEVLRDIGHAFQKISNPPAKTPNADTDPKTIPSKP